MPAGFTPPVQAYPSYPSAPTKGTPVSTTSQTSITQDQTNQSDSQENEPSSQKRSATPTPNEEGPSSPKRSRRSGPYGRWETVAEYEYVEPVAEENTVPEEPEVEENQEDIVEFEEKTLPVKQQPSEPEPEKEFSGGFKKFSFKKRPSGKAPIKLRTTQLS